MAACQGPWFLITASTHVCTSVQGIYPLWTMSPPTDRAHAPSVAPSTSAASAFANGENPASDALSSDEGVCVWGGGVVPARWNARFAVVLTW